MEKNNKRRATRYDSLNLLSYVCIDSDGKEWKQGMGRTLNISESGIMLETHEPIETKYLLMLSLGIEDNVVDIKGEVVYCNRGEIEGRFESGIAFGEVNSPEALEALNRFIEAFDKQYG
ncbi:MAG: PilZ domain-containing protein [Deltaproteobacteria bacterium]|nr:PilZ domain-containing protein [Deltaproteobacteria bacterium]